MYKAGAGDIYMMALMETCRPCYEGPERTLSQHSADVKTVQAQREWINDRRRSQDHQLIPNGLWRRSLKAVGEADGPLEDEL